MNGGTGFSRMAGWQAHASLVRGCHRSVVTVTTQSSTTPTPVAPCVGERGDQPLCPLASWELRFQHLPEDKTLSGGPRPGWVPGTRSADGSTKGAEGLPATESLWVETSG